MKLPMPDAYCVKCHMPYLHPTSLSLKCYRPVGGTQRSGGGVRSANNVGDWAECSTPQRSAELTRVCSFELTR